MITFQDKVALNENPDIPEINKITDDNINDLKAGINTNETNITNLTTYSTNEIVIGTTDNNEPIYRKIIIENVNNGSSMSDISNLNIKEIYDYASVCYRKGQYNNDYEKPYYSGQDDYFRVFFRTSSVSSDYPTSIQYRIASSYSSFKIITTIYYTKATD